MHVELVMMDKVLENISSSFSCKTLDKDTGFWDKVMLLRFPKKSKEEVGFEV